MQPPLPDVLKMDRKKLAGYTLMLLFLTGQALAAPMPIGPYIWSKAKVPICGLYLAVIYMGGALCALMIVYGAVKWMGGSDDPGARKTAKDLIIHAGVGLIILVIGSGLVAYASGGELTGCA